MSDGDIERLRSENADLKMRLVASRNEMISLRERMLGVASGEISPMASMQELMDEFFGVIVKTHSVDRFRALMKARAEFALRQLPMTPKENRDMMAGQISICYELADGAERAFLAEAAEAKANDAGEILRLPDVGG